MDKTREAAEEINSKWMELSLLSPSLRKKRIEATLRRVLGAIQLPAVGRISSNMSDRISRTLSQGSDEGKSEREPKGRKKERD